MAVRKNATTVEFKETKANGKAAPKSAPFIDPIFTDSAPVDEGQFDLRSFLAMAGVTLPGWKRSLITAIACFATGYLIGAVAAVVLDTLMVATAAATGSMFLVACVYVIGMIVALYAAYAAGRAVAQYFLSGSVDKDVAAVKAKFTGWFGIAKRTVQAA